MVQSRHTDPADARFPNHLFSWVHSSTLLVGTEFYNFVKFLSFIFLAGFGVIIYLLARKMLGLWISIAVALAAAAGPASLYGSIFMPEAMYISLGSAVKRDKLKQKWESKPWETLTTTSKQKNLDGLSRDTFLKSLIHM